MIHKYLMNGYNIVLDVGSGSVHVMDKRAYRLVTRLEERLNAGEGIYDILKTESRTTGNEAGVNNDADDNADLEAFNEVKKLVDEGLLFSRDITANTHGSERVVKAMCLHVAHDCNMRCAYCFADEGGYGGGRSLMSLETGKAAIDFLVKNSGGRHNLEVDFFGGEPLINLDVVKGIVEYARGISNKNFRFTLTTNGLLLDQEVGAFLNAEMDNVVMSIDGRKSVTDRMRRIHRTHNTQASKSDDMSAESGYDVIVPNYKEFIKSRGDKSYYLRGTYTRRNLDFANDVLHLAELGFKRISVEPVVATGKESYAITEQDLPVLIAEYERLAAEMAEMPGNNGFEFFHFNIDLEGGPCAAKRLGGCGAGVEYLAVTPEGDLYPCHQFVGVPEYKMGDLQAGVTNMEKLGRFKGCNVNNKPSCMECWCKYYCGGGCAANAYHASGDILQTYNIGCELQKKRVECSLMLKAARSGAGYDV